MTPIPTKYLDRIIRDLPRPANAGAISHELVAQLGSLPLRCLRLREVPHAINATSTFWAEGLDLPGRGLLLVLICEHRSSDTAVRVGIPVRLNGEPVCLPDGTMLSHSQLNQLDSLRLAQV